jgi:hypothetical protein
MVFVCNHVNWMDATLIYKLIKFRFWQSTTLKLKTLNVVEYQILKKKIIISPFRIELNLKSNIYIYIFKGLDIIETMLLYTHDYSRLDVDSVGSIDPPFACLVFIICSLYFHVVPLVT